MNKSQISKTDFKVKVRQYSRQIEASGHALVVTHHGRPTLEVHPNRNIARKPLDVLRGSVLHYMRSADPIAVDEWTAAK